MFDLIQCCVVFCFSATEKRLIAGATPMNVVSNTSSYKPTTMSFSTSPAVTSMPVISSSSTLKLNYVDEILKSNLFCCECSKNDPDWVCAPNSKLSPCFCIFF